MLCYFTGISDIFLWRIVYIYNCSQKKATGNGGYNVYRDQTISDNCNSKTPMLRISKQ